MTLYFRRFFSATTASSFGFLLGGGLLFPSVALAQSSPVESSVAPGAATAAPPPAPAPVTGPGAAGEPNAPDAAPEKAETPAPAPPPEEVKAPEPAPSAEAIKSPASPESEGDKKPTKEEAPYEGPATLLGGEGKPPHLGGYGGFSVAGTSINKAAGVLLGAEGAFLIDHRLALGLAGYGLASEVNGPEFAFGDESMLGFGYGGMTLRYHFIGKRSPISISIGTLIGAGGLALLRRIDGSDGEFEEPEEGSVFFIAEPGVQVNMHFTRWMRAGIVTSYRFVNGPSLRGIEDADLQGIVAGGHLQFGRF